MLELLRLEFEFLVFGDFGAGPNQVEPPFVACGDVRIIFREGPIASSTNIGILGSDEIRTVLARPRLGSIGRAATQHEVACGV